MKVYVVTIEDECQGKQVDSVFTSLDMAQEKMRIEFDGYREQHPDFGVEWYRGDAIRLWGWWDVDRQGGCFITENEIQQ